MPRRRWSFWMSPLDHGFIRILDDLYRARLTVAGQAVFLAALGAGVILLGGIVPTLAMAFGFLCSLLLAAMLCGVPYRPDVKVWRRLPPPPSAGDVWGYDVNLENTSHHGAHRIHVHERGLPAELRPIGEPPIIEHLAPGEAAVVRMHLRCTLRGEYHLGPIDASSSFPSGLVKLACRNDSHARILVYPHFDRLESFEVPMGRTHQPGGMPVASNVGESAEFHGLRDWRDGDRPRDVHWPTYARSGKLVVREFQEEYFARLALVLDIEARTARDEPIFEMALSRAAAIADALARKEYLIDIFAAGDSVHHLLAGRALANMENILELLACLEPGDRLDVGALEAAIIPLASRLSAVIFVMTDWDASRSAVVLKMRALGVAVRVVCVRPGVSITGLAPEEMAQG